MHKIITIVLLNFLLVSNSYAASWTALQDNKHAKLMLDKQSITETGKYQKAWVAITYKAMQTNIQYPEKSYNNAKLLWYFNCAEQKSATAQVYQLLNDEQVFSAAIDIKRAGFLEPVPETEIDLAMRYVCKQKAYKEAVKAKIETAKKEHEAALAKAKLADDGKGKKKKKPIEKKVAAPETKDAVKEGTEGEETSGEKTGDTKKDKDSKEKSKSDKHDKASAKDKKKALAKKKKSDKKKKPKVVRWKYTGKKGPEFWGDLSAEFATCKTGRNQSPIDIGKTIVTERKPLKTFQRFPVVDILNNGHTIQANFKSGNIMAMDGAMFQMKQVHFHTPSENKINGQSYPLEAHFVHVDPKGNLAVLAVMYEEGPENKALAKLWKKMPKYKSKKSKKLASKVLAGQLIPRQKEYYRFSGSLTTPPCSEGVIWIVMKATMTASASQIKAFKKVMKHDNNRPVQPLNGRLIIE